LEYVGGTMMGEVGDLMAQQVALVHLPFETVGLTC